MATLQADIAVNYANQVMSITQQLRNVLAAITPITGVNATKPLGTLWTALQTTAVLADGTLGAADASQTPNAAHPIDPRIYTQLNRAVKSGDLTNALQVLVDFQAFMAGTLEEPAGNGARAGNVNNVAA